MVECYKWKRKEINKNSVRKPDNGGCGRELYDIDKTIIAALAKSESKQGKAISAWKAIQVDSGATAHMVV